MTAAIIRECQRRALAAAGSADFPARQAAARREGRPHRHRALRTMSRRTGRGPFESAAIRIGASGKIVVTTGATAQGQGVKTMLAQARRRRCSASTQPRSMSSIGDTAAIPLGLGAFASRQAVTAGNAVYRRRADRVREKAKQAAAATARRPRTDDFELVGGTVRIKGVPSCNVSIGEIARALGGAPGFALPGGLRRALPPRSISAAGA